MTKKPIPLWPSDAIVCPSLNVRSFMELATPCSSFLLRSAKSGMPWTSSVGALIRTPILCRFLSARQLLDAAVRGVELLAAELVELLAALPEPDRLVERRLSGLEALDDFLQLFLRALERHVTCSTRPPKPPSASSTSTRVPAATWCPARTIVPPARTIA